MAEANWAIQELLPDKMTINFNVFGSFMKNRIPGNVNGYKIVTFDENGSDRSDIKLM